MGKIYAYLQKKENRDFLGWLGGGITVVAAGFWAVLTFFWSPAPKPPHPSPDTCFEGELHPNALKIVSNYHGHLEKGGHTYGWKGGAANNGDPSKRFDAIITDVVSDQDVLHIRYSHSEGVLRLKPILPKLGSAAPGTPFEGEWLQNNGKGCAELMFHPIDGTAIGWWSPDLKKADKYSSYISLISNTPAPPSKDKDVVVSDSTCQFASINQYVQHVKSGGTFNAPVCARDRKLIFKRCVAMNGGNVHGPDEFQPNSCCHHLSIGDAKELGVCGR